MAVQDLTPCPVFASVVMGVVCWLILDLSRPFFADVMSLAQQILPVGGLVFTGGLTYLVMAVLLRMEELGKIGRLRYIFRRASKNRPRLPIAFIDFRLWAMD